MIPLVLYAGEATGPNVNGRFSEFSSTIRGLNSPGTVINIGMGSSCIYPIPLYNHLRSDGFRVRILNGLEVRGMRKSRVRKTSNGTIDAESIARYLMIGENRKTFTVPDDFRNLREIITAYSIMAIKIRTAKNNLIRALDMIFPGLSNAIEINPGTPDMLNLYTTPGDSLSADINGIGNYVSKRRARRVKKIAENSPANPSIERSLRMEISSLTRILNVPVEEKKNLENAMKPDPVVENHAIMAIPRMVQ